MLKRKSKKESQEKLDSHENLEKEGIDDGERKKDNEHHKHQPHHKKKEEEQKEEEVEQELNNSQIFEEEIKELEQAKVWNSFTGNNMSWQNQDSSGPQGQDIFYSDRTQNTNQNFF